MSKTRECSSCGKKKALDAEHFPQHPGCTDGYRPKCLVCYNDKRKAVHGAPRDEKPVKVKTVEEKLDTVSEHRLKRENADLKAKNAELARQIVENTDYAEVLQEVMARQKTSRAPVIAPRERKSRLQEATPFIIASDWHVEERVRPENVAGRNRYDLAIAKKRMQRHFEKSRLTIQHQREMFKIRDVCMGFLGDFITNHLHDDDAEENQLSPTDAIMFAEQGLIDGLNFMLEDKELDQIVIPMVDGNHGRLPFTRRMRHATRTKHSLEVFMYAHIAMHFRNEKRLKFILPESQFVFVDIYGRTVRCIHGDIFKYAGGVGGITVPLMKALARWESVRHADLTAMGHWHQRINFSNVMINGSLIGFNNYALAGGFAFEAPAQSVRMLSPTRFIGADIPLYVSALEDDASYKG